MIYKNFKDTLIRDFETKRDMLVIKENAGNPESLFGIKDTNDRLYISILNWFEIIAIRNVENLVADLCREKGVGYYENLQQKSNFDMLIEVDGVHKYVEFKSQPNSMNSAQLDRLARQIKEEESPVMMVFLLKDGATSRAAINNFCSRICMMQDISFECMTFEDFLERTFGVDEKIAFQEEMADFKEEMHKAIGYQVTELCSPYNLDKLKKELSQEILNFDYDSIKEQRHKDLQASGQRVSDLNKNNYVTVKNVFLNNGRYKLLLGNADFAESFLTSEWLYKKYFALNELDNTFIVTGFLKSIEQLLWDIIFIIGQGRDIKGITISEGNKEDVDKTLGSLQHFLSNWSNDDLFLNCFGAGKHAVMNYLKSQISDWRKQYRNGYFHKHNLKDKTKIEAIREETYFLYLLIFGTIKLSPSEIKRLS